MNEKELAAEKEWDEFFALNREDSDEEKKSCDEGFIAPPAEDEDDDSDDALMNKLTDGAAAN
jgi:hypothetical protein